MTKNYDQDFGPNGRYSWPASLEIAERFLEAAPYAESTAACLDDDFFDEYLSHLDEKIFEYYPEEEAYKLQKAAVKERREFFKEARNWPLDTFVGSATYKILSTEAEQIYMISRLWHCFFWPFLVFDEPLFSMLRAKGWGEVYRKEIREGFRNKLWFQIRGLSGNRVL